MQLFRRLFETEGNKILTTKKVIKHLKNFFNLFLMNKNDWSLFLFWTNPMVWFPPFIPNSPLNSYLYFFFDARETKKIDKEIRQDAPVKV